jgi:hypothetical protein
VVPLGPQKEASLAIDSQIHKELIRDAPTQRERQRVRRVAQPHAGAFVTAVPSEEDGIDTVIPPRNFRVAVALRLGIKVLPPNVKCPLCMQFIDVFGDHAACCTKTSDIVVRHNRVRNLVHRFCSEGLLAPELEKKGILGETAGPGRRPGDVALPLWEGGRGLAIDVAITSTFSAYNVRLEEPCEDYALTRKHRKYDRGFVGSRFDFSALVLETTGAINQEGENILKQIFRFAARREGRGLSVYSGRAWARLSCNLQTSVSQAILNRISGQVGARPEGADLTEAETEKERHEIKKEPRKECMKSPWRISETWREENLKKLRQSERE